MSAVIGSSLAQRIAGLARQKVIEKNVTKLGRNPRPLVNFMDSRKKKTQFTGDGVLVPIKEVAYNIGTQKWSGAVTLQNPSGVQNVMMASFQSSNMFSNTFWGYDDLRKASGVTILPNDNGAKSADSRATRRERSAELVLYNRLAEDMESFEDRVEQLRDLELHRQGATSDDLAGLFALMPIQNVGNYGGLSRNTIPVVQHVLFAGSITEISGVPWMGAAGTTGASGTLLTQIEKFIRTLRAAAYTSGLPKGRWKFFGGSGFYDKLKGQMRQEKIQFQIDAKDGNSMLNLLISDERIGLSAPDIDMVLDYTLDAIDTEFPSEVGLAPSQLTLAFSGGGSPTTQASGFAYVAANGTIANVQIVQRGAGYTSAPTIAIGNAGGGTTGSITCTVYSASSGGGLTQVDADDVRIGKVATVTIANAGTGYATTGTAAACTNRLYALYEPSWDYLVQDGLDSYMSIPADNPRARQLEQQWDHTHALTNNCPRVNGILVAA